MGNHPSNVHFLSSFSFCQIYDIASVSSSMNFSVLHSLSFIRNAYKEGFSWLLKYFEKIRNTLVIFLKIKEQTSLKIGKKHGFSSKIMLSLGYILVAKLKNGYW